MSIRPRPSSLALGVALAIALLAVARPGVTKEPKKAPAAEVGEKDSKLSWLAFDVAKIGRAHV